MKTFNFARISYIGLILIATYIYFKGQNESLFFNMIIIATVAFNCILNHQVLTELKLLKLHLEQLKSNQNARN